MNRFKFSKIGGAFASGGMAGAFGKKGKKFAAGGVAAGKSGFSLIIHYLTILRYHQAKKVGKNSRMVLRQPEVQKLAKISLRLVKLDSKKVPSLVQMRHLKKEV